MPTRAAKPEDGVAWITGASSGIGRALALELADRGFRVAASARSRAGLEELAADALGAGGAAAIGPIDVHPLDVTDATATEAVVDAIESEAGPIALAVLNAGIYLPVSGADLDLDAFHRSFRVNLDGTVNGLVPLIARMKARGHGQIAIVSSVAGYSGLPTSAAYGATKAALINLAESLKFELDPLGIRIQVINPGFVETPATDRNPFPMPFLVPVNKAARRIADGLTEDRFEITFPRRFTWLLKFGRILPYRVYFPLARRLMGVKG